MKVRLEVGPRNEELIALVKTTHGNKDKFYELWANYPQNKLLDALYYATEDEDWHNEHGFDWGNVEEWLDRHLYEDCISYIVDAV